jgi:hypothetical protein
VLIHLLVATQTYDLTCTWVASILAAALAPPAVACWRNRQLSARRIMGLAVACFVAVSCVVYEIGSVYWIMRHDLYATSTKPGEWWHVPAVFFASVLLTLSITNSVPKTTDN